VEVKLAITSTLNSLQAVGCVTELAYKIASGDLKVSLLITFTLERPTLRQAFKFNCKHVPPSYFKGRKRGQFVDPTSNIQQHPTCWPRVNTMLGMILAAVGRCSIGFDFV
jgi:hypothetical protein